MKINQIGRSMVEIIGVLAIVGVLSVGAIAGYGKAMTKYKLNKHTMQIGTILDFMHIHTDELIRMRDSMKAGTNGLDFKTMMIKLGAIPSEMIKGNNIKDIFGNSIGFSITIAQGYYWFETTVGTGGNKDVCVNLFELAKLKKEDIYRVKMHKNGSTANKDIYGEADCTGSRICLRNMTRDDIYEYCSFCDGTARCTFYFQDKYK